MPADTMPGTPSAKPAPLILSVFSTFAIGGPQVRFAAIARRFGPRFRHAIVAMDGNHACAERLDCGADPGLDVQWPEVPIRRGDTLANAVSFRRALKALRPDVLVTSNWGSLEWAWANALPLVRHIHIEDGFGPDERSIQLRRRVWTRRLLLSRRTVVVPSQTLWRIATGIWKLSPARVHYLPNGIDLARFGGAGPRAGGDGPGAGPDAELVIGTVAALRAEKNLGRLLEAFAALPESLGARLVIAGDGPARSGLEAQAAALGIAGRVEFAGHITDPAPLYAGFDVFALSSDTEQMPLSVLEAMAAGLPVAATDVGDIRSMLAAENADYVVPQAVPALAAALQRLLLDPALRQRLGAANRAKAERDYDEETMFQAYAALFEGGAGPGSSGVARPAD
jgi:glycosyltransferase involved in cell wall biosynthesis